MADSALEPDGRRSLGENTGQVCRDMLRPAKYLQEIDGAGYFLQPPIDGRTQNGCYLRVIDRHWDNFVPGRLEILRHKEGRSVSASLRFDPKNRDSTGLPKKAADAIVVVERYDHGLT